MAKLLEKNMKSSCLPIVAIVELELFQHDILRFAIVNIYHSFTIVAMINQQSPRNMDRFMGVAFGSMLGTITIGTCGSLVGIPGCRNHGVCPWGLPMGFAHGVCPWGLPMGKPWPNPGFPMFLVIFSEKQIKKKGPLILDPADMF
jgi:hypothetical protein